MVYAPPTTAPLRAPAWTPAASAAVDAAAASMMARGHLRGMSVTVAHGGTVLFAKGYGLRDVAANAPVTPQTIFPIGSITKTFTATAIGILAQDGKLRLDDPVAGVLPDAPHAREITIAQLLHHTSGLPEYLQGAAVGPYLDAATADPAKLVALVAGRPLLFAPGSQFRYCNTNYVLLGMIVERLAGMPYARFVAQRIAAPAGATTLSFGPPPAGREVALGYDGPDDSPSTPWTPAASYSAGALYAAPLDLVRFDTAFFDDRIVAPPQVAALTTAAVPAGSTQPYAAGWIDDTLDGHRLVWHNGGLPGANTRNAVFPDDGLVVVVFTNAVGGDETPAVRAAFRALYPPTADARAAQDARDRAAVGTISPAMLAVARREFDAWQHGTIDSAHYAPDSAAKFTPAVRTQVTTALAALGTPATFTFLGSTATNDETLYGFRVEAPGGAVAYTIGVQPDGRVHTILFRPAPPTERRGGT